MPVIRRYSSCWPGTVRVRTDDLDALEAEVARLRPSPGPCPQCVDTAGGFRCHDCDYEQNKYGRNLREVMARDA